MSPTQEPRESPRHISISAGTAPLLEIVPDSVSVQSSHLASSVGVYSLLFMPRMMHHIRATHAEFT